MKNGKFCFGVLLIVILTAAPQLFAARSPRALILSGQNNHDWRKTTPTLKQILADNGIDAEITENPENITAQMLSGYDVIVSNYNTFGTQNVDWPDAAKKAFLDFISTGNGHVTVHAGGSSFGNWAEYQQIAAWWAPTTGHGQQHAFPINTVDLDHPICSDFYSVWTRDELWHRTGFPAKSKTLITAFSSSDSGGSGDFEPILTVCEFGDGHCVNFILGHDVAAMQRAVFKLLFTRSVQWAAGQKDLVAVPKYLPRNKLSLQADDITIDKAIENCKPYKYAENRDHLLILQAKVNSIRNDPAASALAAAKIAEMLNSDTSNQCKAFLCNLLGQIDTDRQVPSIAKLLTDPALSMYALQVLEQINTPKAVLAIQNALKIAPDSLVPAILNTLGDLRDTESVNLIKPYLNSNDSSVRSSAIYALSRIGNKKACDILLKLNKGKSAKEDVDLTDNFTWKTTGTSVALMNNSSTVWQFNYSPEKPKPYFHPIALTDGTTLTLNKPPDHVWHHGLWFSWKYINSVNYWEPADRTKGTYAGLTKWSNVIIDQNDDHSAEIDMELQYQPASQPAVLKEQRRINISPPDNTGTYTMDWASTFTAVAETVTLDRTPIPGQQGGRSGGGYAGLSVRISRDARDPKYTTSTGVVELTNGTFRGKEKYMQYAAMINDKDFSITILDSETNINSPSPWYLINNNTMDYFSPAVICYEPLIMAKGDSFTLRYRIIISPARLSTDQLNLAYDIFNKNSK